MACRPGGRLDRDRGHDTCDDGDERPSGAVGLFARITGGDADSQGYKLTGTIGHFAYGGVAGIIFAVIMVDALEWTEAFVGWGLLFGMVLQGVMMMVWAPAISMMSEMMRMNMGARMKMMVFATGAHLVYGALLGWLTQVFI